MSTQISDELAWKRLRFAIGGMMIGALCLIGLVEIVTSIAL